MNRFTQASTWAGVAGVLQALKALFPHYAAALDAATMGAGVLAGVINEQKPPVAGA